MIPFPVLSFLILPVPPFYLFFSFWPLSWALDFVLNLLFSHWFFLLTSFLYLPLLSLCKWCPKYKSSIVFISSVLGLYFQLPVGHPHLSDPHLITNSKSPIVNLLFCLLQSPFSSPLFHFSQLKLHSFQQKYELSGYSWCLSFFHLLYPICHKFSPRKYSLNLLPFCALAVHRRNSLSHFLQPPPLLFSFCTLHRLIA